MKNKIKLEEVPVEFDRYYLMKEDTLNDDNDLKDTIICAYNNATEYPEDAIENLVNAIRKIQNIITKQEMGI